MSNGVRAEIVSLLGCKFEDILQISAKTGQGVEAVLDRIVELVPPPKSLGLAGDTGSDF